MHWSFHTQVVWVVTAPDYHTSGCLYAHSCMLLQVFHNYFLSVCSLSFLGGFFHRSEVDQFGEVTHLIFPLTHHGVNSYLFFLALAIQHIFQSARRHTCLISALGDRGRQVEVTSRSTWSKQRVLGKPATISKQTKNPAITSSCISF